MTNNRICSTESGIEDRCKHRSSSEDGIDQLFFGQFALDKLFKEGAHPSRINGQHSHVIGAISCQSFLGSATFGPVSRSVKPHA